MVGRSLLIFSAVALATVPGPADARSDAVAGGSQASKDLKTRADDPGYLPGRRSFYGFPRHRHIDGRGDTSASYGRPLSGGHEDASNYDRNYGSPYYGINYGAPYFDGGYYDGGTYYRERRD